MIPPLLCGGADPSFLSEEVDAYELGVKAQTANGALTLNVAAFYEEFSNFQVLEFTGTAFATFNVPLAETKGIEIEGLLRPSDELTLNFGATFLEASYPDDCAGTQTSVQVVSLCGNDLTNAPNIVALLGALVGKADQRLDRVLPDRSGSDGKRSAHLDPGDHPSRRG